MESGADTAADPSFFSVIFMSSASRCMLLSDEHSKIEMISLILAVSIFPHSFLK